VSDTQKIFKEKILNLPMKKEVIILIITIILVIVGVTVYYTFLTKSTSQTENETIRVTVTENYQGCAFDDTCLIRFSYKGKERYTIYQYGGITPDGKFPKDCGDENSFEIETGDEIEIYGKWVNDEFLDICDGENLYVHKVQ